MAVDLRYELDLAPESLWIMATPDPAVKRAAAHVLEVGDFIAGKDYYTSRRDLPAYLIKYTLEGAGVLTYGAQTARVGANRAFWIDCMQPQDYRTDPREGHWRVIWVHFYGPGCDAYYRWFLEMGGGRNDVELPVNASAAALMHRLIAIYRDGDNTLADDVNASALLTQLMAEMVAAAGRAAPEGPMPVCVAAARAYLLEHFHENISLAELADMVSLDRFYFQKLFKRHTGLSPKRFQALTRVNRAKELLQATDRPVSEIAGMVGVESASRFIALFRAYEGMTPGAYRKKWQSK